LFLPLNLTEYVGPYAGSLQICLVIFVVMELMERHKGQKVKMALYNWL